MPFKLHYFTIRLWLEDLGGGKVEWRGEVKNSKTGEIRYFRQGPMLLQQLTTMLDDEAAQESASPTPEDSATVLLDDNECE